MARPTRLILGSGSPRRRALLQQIGLVPDEVRVPETDETPLPGERPLTYCRRIALDKAMAVPLAEGEVLVAADTTVAAGRRILGKPADEDEARAFLGLLSGRRHRVITCVVVRTPDRIWRRDVTSTVRMKTLDDGDIARYLASREWDGKAGGYAIQGLAEAFIPWVSGSYSAIVGLPLAETAALLGAAGFEGVR
ncbi:Maf family protein [Palleronia sp. KMU-117]|uniref:Maf family protein n=1 Tax=Palleronia sp. KMU-117 TaxID=3434108 RepID=UPI003D7278A8